MMAVLFRLLLCGMAAAFIFGCAPAHIPVERPPELVWNKFRLGAKSIDPDQSFLIRASISYDSPERSHRIQSSLWGYINYPIRMDLSAGFGQTIAMWHEDERFWQAYFPGENTRYIHPDGSVGASMLGYPTPFDLQQTVKVLLGDFGDLIPEAFYKAETLDGGWKYYFREHEVENIILDQDGSVRSVNGRGWKVEFSGRKDEDMFPYYSRIDMQLSEEQRALVRIKSVELNAEQWDEEQLELKIPPEAQTVHLPGS